jgi:Carboxypeptidase regulatory-like domain/TonB-dependent Receptor Plug Domain
MDGHPRPLLLAALALALVPGPVLARPPLPADTLGTIRGRVVDSTGAPIEGAEVLLIDLSRSGYSDRLGQFTIGFVPPGAHQLVARMVGFEAGGASPRVVAGDTTKVSLTLARSTPRLPDVTVAATEARISPKMRPFEERRRSGIGHFITRDEIAAHEHQRIQNLLRTMPRVQMVERDGEVALAANRAGTMKLPRYLRWPMKCYLQVYLDGILVWRQNTGEDGPYDLSQHPLESLAGIEIYSPGQTPIEYGGIGAFCGTLMLWTR